MLTIKVCAQVSLEAVQDQPGEVATSTSETMQWTQFLYLLTEIQLKNKKG